MSGGQLRVTMALAVVAVISSACAGSDSGKAPLSPSVTPPAGSGSPAKVVLGLYSGVADPTWTLTANETSDLDTALARLTRVNGTAAVGGLGYHGFSIIGPGGTLIAYDGKVASVGSDPPYDLDDPDRTIERLLLETARTHVKPQEFNEVARALDQP